MCENCKNFAIANVFSGSSVTFPLSAVAKSPVWYFGDRCKFAILERSGLRDGRMRENDYVGFGVLSGVGGVLWQLLVEENC